MHLKSLTLRGFKSFASATTLRLEPGITCVVGPNGSGKSNVVDAIAWVMGEQGAKSLRGGKMEDVIFAGAAGRAPLGRAEVALTVDNSDGALPIDYAEVTITRTMFRSGGSEYAINGDPCRLLDVQELLSDSGIGREMHVIVGQGQLDAVLAAGPEERRGFIEEAAGVLKHRKRKEKALRKLDAMQGNLTRVQDLTAELRRQLKPLGQQAEVARRAATVQADLRDARLRLLADDLLALRTELAREVADETAGRERRTLVEAEWATASARERELEAQTAVEAPRLARAQELWYRLSSLRERLRGTASLVAERRRALAAAEAEEQARAAASSARDPEALDREAAEAAQERDRLAREVAGARGALAAAEAERAAAEQRLAGEERRIAALARAAADRREGLARLTGQTAAAASRVAAGEEEVERLGASLAGARDRAAAAQADFTALETQVAGLDAGEEGLDERHERAAAALAAAEAELARLQAEEHAAERERSALEGRLEALQLGLVPRDGAAALLGGEAPDGVVGPAAAEVAVEAGWEVALAAALGPAADAVLVTGWDAALAALERLRREEAGRAALVLPHAPAAGGAWPALPGGARYAVDLLTAPEQLRAALAGLLERVAVAENLDAARALVEGEPALRVVTRAGDVVGAGWVAGGSTRAPSALELHAAADDARASLQAAAQRLERLRFALAAARARRADAAADVEDATARLHESDARIAAVAEQLAHLGSAARAAQGEADRLAQARDAAAAAREQDRVALTALEERLAAAQAEPLEEEPTAHGLEALRVDLERLRGDEVEVRLGVRTLEERSRAAGQHAEQAAREAAAERAARQRLASLRERRGRAGVVAAAVAVGVAEALERIERSLAAAAAERDAAERARTVREGELLGVRARARELAGELERLTDAVHRDEVARAEQRLRVEQLEARAVEELGVDPDTLLAEYGPEVPVPPAPGPDGVPVEGAESRPYDRAEQEKRLRAAERALALLGKVNPLALEEYAALEERHRFLTEQLDDLKRSRRDLLEIVREVDERVQQVFAEAYADTAREFETVFRTLFPGGEGRLALTDPADMLATGVEVLARPAGKKVARLSLLSGGERSLTALALLIAIFRARPSPFYVLDEVEAALDDRNLGRLLECLEGLRATSQLLVVTHQKRTMEIADALYGVTMRGDGVSQVISQRMREAATA